jgi:hypothetical protein
LEQLLRYIAQDDCANPFIAEVDARDRGIVRKFAPVRTQTKHLPSFAHHPAFPSGKTEMIDSHIVRISESLGNEPIQRRPHCIIGSATKDPFGGSVKNQNSLIGIHRDDAIGRGLHQAFQ